MLWIEPCTVLYTGCLGGLLGAFGAVMALRRAHKDQMSCLQSYWNGDIRKLTCSVSELDRRTRELAKLLSTISGENSVSNKGKSLYRCE